MATAFTHQDDYYKMNASPKGICLIINNFEFELSKNLDTGPADRENLTRIFDELDFEVRYFENLTCEEMKRQMYNIKKTNHSNYDCFVCCISSHGNKTGVCGKDDSTLKIIDLQTYVYSRECPSLAGKPKVFFVDTCRGEEGHRGLYLHQPRAPAQGRRVVITDKRDFLLSFATTPDNVSYCNPDPTKGSVYFYHLTLLLKRHAKSKPVLRILQMVNEALTNAHPEQPLQTAEYTSTLAKELRFHHPVQATVTALDQAFARLEFENQPSRPTHRQTKAHRFHDNHGRCVVLSNNQQTAVHMGVSFDGIVMSRDPIEVNKLYEVHITKRGRGVGPLGVGVVTSSPDRLTLPDTACRGWESAVAVYFPCFFDHNDQRGSDVGKALYDLPVDSRVGVSLDPSRRLHLHVNGTDQGVVLCRPLPDQCWAMWDLGRGYSEITCLPVRDLS